MSKSTAKKSEAAAPAAATTTEAPQVHGTVLSNGDVKAGGTGKKPLVGVIPLKSISVLKGFNPRQHIISAEVEELANNIKANGLLQSLVVRPIPGKDGHFALISGEKRYRACTIAGIENVQVTFRSDLAEDDARAKAIAIAENSDDLRSGLNPIELGRALHALHTQEKWGIPKISAETGLHSQRVRRCLSLMDAPANVQKLVEDKKLSMISGLEIAKLDESTRKAMAAELSAKIAEAGDKTVDLSAAEVKKMAKAHAKGSTVVDGKGANKKTGAARDAALTAWKGQRVKQQDIVNLAYAINAATEDEQQTLDHAELRGALAFALYDRGDLDTYMLPNAGSTESDDVKTLKLFNSTVATEAAKHSDAKAAAAEAAEQDAAPATQEAVEPKTGKVKKSSKGKA